MKHETGECDEVEAAQDVWQTLVVAGETAEASGPGERAFDAPAPGQQDEAAFGFGQLDHFETNAMRLGIVCRLLSGVALIDIGHLDIPGGGVLNGFGQATTLFRKTLCAGVTLSRCHSLSFQRPRWPAKPDSGGLTNIETATSFEALGRDYHGHQARFLTLELTFRLPQHIVTLDNGEATRPNIKTFLLNQGYSGEGEAEFDRILQDVRRDFPDLLSHRGKE